MCVCVCLLNEWGRFVADTIHIILFIDVYWKINFDGN